MRRYWLPKESFQDDEILIEGETFRHIFKVCRRQVGDRFEVLTDDGRAHLVEVTELKGKVAHCRELEVRELPALPQPHIHLALSVSKPATMEKVIEKSVELGVQSLHFFSSDFSFAKFKEKDFENKQRRWQRILLGATQQTGRGDLMKLTFHQSLNVLLEESTAAEEALGIFAYEGEAPQKLSQALEERPSEMKNLWIFVGSEGGFSENDVKLFSDFKMIPTSLGDQVLRVETACVTLVSIIKYDLGLL